MTVPSAGPQRLPIFDSLESDWFRRSGTTMTGPQRALSSAAPPAGQPGGVDVARGRGLACGSGGRVARGGRNYSGRAAQTGSEG